MTTIVICSNPEMLTMDMDTENSPLSDAEIAQAAVNETIRQAYGLLPDVTIETDQCFRNWNGGKYDQFWFRCGSVAIDRADKGTAIEAAAWRINNILTTELENHDDY